MSAGDTYIIFPRGYPTVPRLPWKRGEWGEREYMKERGKWKGGQVNVKGMEMRDDGRGRIEFES